MTDDRLTYRYRRRGLDHQWFEQEPIVRRPPLAWPGGRPVALWISVAVEFFPLDAPLQPFRPLGGLDRGYPDFWTYSNRDYGNRIGVYRIMRVLDRLGLRATAAVNAAVAPRFPRLIAEMVRRDWEIAAHGLDMGRVHHGALPASEERALIEETRDTLTRVSGLVVKGWYSPGRGESVDTLRLLCENGFEYVADWANDDLPYMMKADASTICAMPLTHEGADRILLVHHNRTVEDYERQVLGAFRVLKAEAGRYGGRVLSLSLSPWVIGYPHRIAALERILASIMESDAVWPATGIAIADAFKDQTGRQTDRNAQA
jgi:peptidoglycan/xylan/chitin deacetylase (PgdA/CDA1 family)